MKQWLEMGYVLLMEASPEVILIKEEVAPVSSGPKNIFREVVKLIDYNLDWSLIDFNYLYNILVIMGLEMNSKQIFYVRSFYPQPNWYLRGRFDQRKLL